MSASVCKTLTDSRFIQVERTHSSLDCFRNLASEPLAFQSEKIMKNLLTILLLVAFFANVLLAQRTRPGVPGVYKPTVEKIEINDAANDFGEKGLPQADIIGSNPSDELAKHLAKEISKYDENSLPLLMATLQKAGFYIINDQQKILYKPSYGKGMGLAFYDFEVAGMYKLSRGGLVTSMTKVMAVVGSKIPKYPSVDAASVVLDGIREATKSKDQTVRFFARLVIELGKNFPTPVDLMTVSPENAQLSFIQASLIERRLIGDFIAYATKGNASRFPAFKDDRNAQQLIFSNSAKFTKASFFHSPVNQDEPCDFDNVENLTTDIESTVASTIGGKIVEKLIDKLPFAEKTIEKIGIGLGGLNAVLSWAKILAANSQVVAKFDIAEPIPLIRTKTTTDGAEKKVTATFEIKPNNLRQINCGRLAINAATGFEFSMPSSGPMANKPTTWELGNRGQMTNLEGGDIVYLDSLDRSSADKQQTNGNGVTTIKLTGKGQRRDMSNEKLVPVPKKVKLTVSIAQKNMSDIKQEGADLAAHGLSTGMLIAGGATPPGWILLVVGGIPEMTNRMKLSAFGVIVPVRDWQPCSEDWGGIINVKRDYSKTIVIKASRRSNGNSSGDGVRTIIEHDEADITLNPRTPEEILQKVDRKPATVVGNGKHSDIFRLIREADPCCDKTEGSWKTKIQEGKIETYDSIIKDPFRFSVRATERDYSLSFEYNSFNFPGHRREFKEVDSDCDFERDESFDKTEDATINFSPSLASGRYGERVVNPEGELMFGTKEITAGDGAKMTWKWALARCQK